VVVLLAFGVGEASADPPPSRRILLNGAAIDDIRDITLVDVRVVIAPDGTIRLTNPAYRVERRPGMAAQIVRRSLEPVSQQTFLVSEVTARHGLRPPFVVRVYVDDKHVHTVDGSVSRGTTDITGALVKGKNNVRFQVLAQHLPSGTDPDATVTVTLGLGKRTGQMLAIDRVLTTFTRGGRDSGSPIVDRVIDLSPKSAP